MPNGPLTVHFDTDVINITKAKRQSWPNQGQCLPLPTLSPDAATARSVANGDWRRRGQWPLHGHCQPRTVATSEPGDSGGEGRSSETVLYKKNVYKTTVKDL